MSEAATFFLGAVAVLATPGPTNTLLATSGAISGFRRSLPLLSGELGGYLLAIVVLVSLVGPIVAAMPAFGLALRIVVCLYLLYLAAMLWRQSGLPIADARPIGPLRVFVTTLLNPKAIIFAFTLLPVGPIGWPRCGAAASRHPFGADRFDRHLLDRSRLVAAAWLPWDRQAPSRLSRRCGRASAGGRIGQRQRYRDGVELSRRGSS
jgi:LysE type translocator